MHAADAGDNNTVYLAERSFPRRSLAALEVFEPREQRVLWRRGLHGASDRPAPDRLSRGCLVQGRLELCGARR